MRRVFGSKSGSLLLAVSMAALAASPVTASQRLLNPGFEAPPSTAGTDNVIAAWTPVNSGMTRATFAKHDGNYGLWLQTFQLIGGGASQEAVVVPNTPYNLSAWAKYEAGFLSEVGTMVDMKIDWLDAGGGILSTDGLNITPENAATTVGTDNTWNLLTLPTVTAPAAAAKARVSFQWDFGNAGPVNPQSFFFDDVIFDGQGPNLGGAIWLADGSGDWNVPANWSSGTTPNAIGAEAQLLDIISAPRTLYSDTAITVGTINFDNNSTYVIAGAGAMTVDVATGTGAFNVVKGNHKINLPLTLNDSTVATIAAGASLTIGDPLTLVGGSTLTASGGGTLNIISTVNNAANATIVSGGATINAGLDLTNKIAINASSGQINLLATQHLNTVAGAGGKITLASGKKLIRANSVTMSGTSSLDLADGRLIIDYSVTPPLASIRNQITSGRAGGAWNGAGINSSVAATNSRLAIGSAVASVVGATSFAGETVDGTTLLVATTLKGDANLNFVVNFDDLLLLAQNYGGTSKIWTHGDSDYNGTVNFDDLLALAQNYGSTYLTDGSIVVDATMNANFQSDWAMALSVVPEPATLGLLGGAIVLLARRRA
jgi:hypothetical protein